MKALADKECQLVGILAWSGNTNRSRPIVVKVCKLVSQSTVNKYQTTQSLVTFLVPLHVIRLQSCSIMYNHVVCGSDCSLIDMLTDQIVIIPAVYVHVHSNIVPLFSDLPSSLGDGIVQHSSRWRIFKLLIERKAHESITNSINRGYHYNISHTIVV